VKRDKLEAELPTDDDEELDEYEGSSTQDEDIDNHRLDIELGQHETDQLGGPVFTPTFKDTSHNIQPMNQKLKDKWIVALEETIAKYEQAIIHEEMPWADSNVCPLCILTDKLNGANQDPLDPCKHCIHYSKYGSQTHCSHQPSCTNATNFTKDITLYSKQATKYRIYVLKGIIKRLKA